MTPYQQLACHVGTAAGLINYWVDFDAAQRAGSRKQTSFHPNYQGQ